jgi:1-acyl-sn-glycerol-3-phosphate acyltransferase
MSQQRSYRFYQVAGLVVKPLMRFWFRMRVEGAHQLPAEGPVILAANHRSNIDPVLVASAVRRPVTFMAKSELFVGPLGWLLRLIRQFPVHRGSIDREALRQSSEVVSAGGVLGLFPEGRRGDGGFNMIHSGLAYIVLRQPCPVVPVAIFGTERLGRRFGWLPLATPVRIVVGPAMASPDLEGGRAGRRAASEAFGQMLRDFLAGIDRGADDEVGSINLQSNKAAKQ